MSLKIRDEITPELEKLRQRLAHPEAVLLAGVKVVQEVDLRARINAALWRLPWPLSGRSSVVLKNYSAQQLAWMKKSGRVVIWPILQSGMPGDIVRLTSHRATVLLAPESRAAVAAAKPQIIRAMQAKVDDMVRSR